jgi:hypothetical protein
MVSEPVKLSRCAQPPSTDCSGQVQPRKPKSWSREGTSGLSAPPSAHSSKAASMMSRARRLSVATVVGYLRAAAAAWWAAWWVWWAVAWAMAWAVVGEADGRGGGRHGWWAGASEAGERGRRAGWQLSSSRTAPARLDGYRRSCLVQHLAAGRRPGGRAAAQQPAARRQLRAPHQQPAVSSVMRTTSWSAASPGRCTAARTRRAQ